jgi:hypothetical protein
MSTIWTLKNFTIPLLHYIHIQDPVHNRPGGVMVNVLISSTVDHGFEHKSTI